MEHGNKAFTHPTPVDHQEAGLKLGSNPSRARANWGGWKRSRRANCSPPLCSVSLGAQQASVGMAGGRHTQQQTGCCYQCHASNQTAKKKQRHRPPEKSYRLGLAPDQKCLWLKIGTPYASLVHEMDRNLGSPGGSILTHTQMGGDH